MRLARRFLAAELRLSLVPDGEQRTWRTWTRGKHQKRRHRIQVQNQIEALLALNPDAVEKRMNRLLRQMRKLGYQVEVKPIASAS